MSIFDSVKREFIKDIEKDVNNEHPMFYVAEEI